MFKKFDLKKLENSRTVRRLLSS